MKIENWIFLYVIDNQLYIIKLELSPFLSNYCFLFGALTLVKDADSLAKAKAPNQIKKQVVAIYEILQLLIYLILENETITSNLIAQVTIVQTI